MPEFGAANLPKLYGNAPTPWSTVPIPWIAEGGAVTGSMTASIGYFNLLAVNDEVVAQTTNFLACLYVAHNIFAPSSGIRFAIYGHLTINSVGTNLRGNAFYSGVQGRVDINSSMGGVSGTPSGSGWGANFIGAVNVGAFIDQIYGAELDVFVNAGCTVDSKIGLLIACEGTDAVQGTSIDTALLIASTAGHQVPWKVGITFGRIASSQWPFDATSTMIGTSTAGVAGIGIDLSAVAFTTAAIKTPGFQIDATGHAKLTVNPFVTNDKYLVIDSTGNVHVSALGPAS